MVVNKNSIALFSFLNSAVLEANFLNIKLEEANTYFKFKQDKTIYRSEEIKLNRNKWDILRADLI